MPKPILHDCGGPGQPPCPPEPASPTKPATELSKVPDEEVELDQTLAEYLKQQGK